MQTQSCLLTEVLCESCRAVLNVGSTFNVVNVQERFCQDSAGWRAEWWLRKAACVDSRQQYERDCCTTRHYALCNKGPSVIEDHAGLGDFYYFAP